MAIKNNVKGGSVINDLGCSIPDFRLYIEAQFSPGMTWDNWTYLGWHLDHKIPLAKFDLSNPAQFARAVHFSNYQPLWAEQNMRKNRFVAADDL